MSGVEEQRVEVLVLAVLVAALVVVVLTLSKLPGEPLFLPAGIWAISSSVCLGNDKEEGGGERGNGMS